MAIAALPQTAAEDPLAELKELLRTAGVATAGEMVQHRDHPDPNLYLGKGKLTDLKAEIARSDANWSPATTSWSRGRSATSKPSSGCR